MNCTDFERALTALLADDDDNADRLAMLREHAEACSQCGGAADLLELLSLSPAERDLVESPAGSYWEEFDSGLRLRLAQSGPPAGRGWTPWAGIAAALLLAAAGIWLVLSPGDAAPPGGTVRATGEQGGEIPDTLEALLRQAEPDEALAGLDFLVGLPGCSGVGAGAAESASGNNEPSGSGAPFFPDPEQMDAEARRALLDWLRERTVRDRGVES